MPSNAARLGMRRFGNQLLDLLHMLPVANRIPPSSGIPVMPFRCVQVALGNADAPTSFRWKANSNGGGHFLNPFVRNSPNRDTPIFACPALPYPHGRDLQAIRVSLSPRRRRMCQRCPGRSSVPTFWSTTLPHRNSLADTRTHRQ